MNRYKGRPVEYSEEKLGGWTEDNPRPAHIPPFWWSKQQEIARKLITPPHRVLVRACHSVGKSHVVAGLINWFFDAHRPGITLTTSPKYDQVKDVLWKEIRLQRRGRESVFPGPKAPRMETSPNHYATGFTANRGAAAQGQHEKYVLGVIDEAVGVDKEIWFAMDSMCTHMLALCNPTDPGSEFYRREQTGGWHLVTISALEHPNIIAELQGLPAPYPKAVRLQWLRDRIVTDRWAELIDGDPQPGDFEFEGKWYHPGPLAECRLLGLWPSAAGNVWSEKLFVSCEKRPPFKWSPDEPKPPEIGCDVAHFGDDDTAIHVRWGCNSIHHESHNGWTGPQIVGRLKQLAIEYAAFANARRNPVVRPFKPQEIPVKVDACGLGGMGVVDWRGDWNFIDESAARKANAELLYPRRRDEFWFDVQERAKAGLLSFAYLSPDVRLKLRLEALAPSYTIDHSGRRVVEPKHITKERLGHSPDNFDAVNLAYTEHSGEVTHWVDPEEDKNVSMGAKLGILGRGDGRRQEGPRIRTLGR